MVLSLYNFLAPELAGLPPGANYSAIAGAPNLRERLTALPGKDLEHFRLLGAGWDLDRLSRLGRAPEAPPPPDTFMEVFNDYHLLRFFPKTLKLRFKEPRRKPFFLQVEYKYLLFPLDDGELPGQRDALSPESRRRLALYKERPAAYADKVWLLDLLFDDLIERTRARPVRAAVEALVRRHRLSPEWLDFEREIGDSRELRALWRRSKGAAADAVLVRELFAGKVRAVRDNIGELLTLLPDGERERTEVFVAGEPDPMAAKREVLFSGFYEMMEWPAPALNPGAEAARISAVMEERR